MHPDAAYSPRTEPTPDAGAPAEEHHVRFTDARVEPRVDFYRGDEATAAEILAKLPPELTMIPTFVVLDDSGNIIGQRMIENNLHGTGIPATAHAHADAEVDVESKAPEQQDPRFSGTQSASTTTSGTQSASNTDSAGTATSPGGADGRITKNPANRPRRLRADGSESYASQLAGRRILLRGLSASPMEMADLRLKVRANSFYHQMYAKNDAGAPFDVSELTDRMREDYEVLEYLDGEFLKPDYPVSDPAPVWDRPVKERRHHRPLTREEKERIYYQATEPLLLNRIPARLPHGRKPPFGTADWLRSPLTVGVCPELEALVYLPKDAAPHESDREVLLKNHHLAQLVPGECDLALAAAQAMLALEEWHEDRAQEQAAAQAQHHVGAEAELQAWAPAFQLLSWHRKDHPLYRDMPKTLQPLKMPGLQLKSIAARPTDWLGHPLLLGRLVEVFAEYFAGPYVLFAPTTDLLVVIARDDPGMSECYQEVYLRYSYGGPNSLIHHPLIIQTDGIHYWLEADYELLEEPHGDQAAALASGIDQPGTFTGNPLSNAFQKSE